MRAVLGQQRRRNRPGPLPVGVRGARRADDARVQAVWVSKRGETGKAQTAAWASEKTARTRWRSGRDTDRMAMSRAVRD
jgi:hypothetical protein